MLLLFSVRMVRVGIERTYGAQLRNLLKNHSGRLSAAISGCAMAIVLQGATAVILLTSSLVASGVAGLAVGLAIVIGADLGSAIVIRILTFDIQGVIPVLLAIGGWAYLKGSEAMARNIGRVVLGIGLILMSLGLISAAVAPIKEASFLPALAGYLERDPVSAFLLGAGFTILLHSSIASILVAVTIVASGGFSVGVGVFFVLGANLGSSFLPVWLTRSASAQERMLPLANFILRGAAATLALIALIVMEAPSWIEGFLVGGGGVITAHLIFNTLLLLALAVTPQIAAQVQKRMLPAAPDVTMPQGRLGVATADASASPVSVMRRDVLLALDTVSLMIAETEKVLAGDNATTAIEAHEDQVNQTLNRLRQFYAQSQAAATKPEQKQMRQLLEYAVKLEHSGDIVAKRIGVLAQEMQRGNLSFSDAASDDIAALRRMAVANTYLAFEVLSNWSTDSARTLVERKEEFSRRDQKLRKQHFKELAARRSGALETSDYFLELTAAYKEINSKIATIGYAVLDADGQLAQSRLIETPERAAE